MKVSCQCFCYYLIQFPIKIHQELEILNRTKSKFNTKFGCRLCNLEKIQIDKTDKTKSLNKKSERQNICIQYQNFLTKLNLK